MAYIEIEFYEKGQDVLFIFTGIGGTTKGYQNKYELIANQVVKDYGFSVAVVATPHGALLTLNDNMQYVMNFLFEQKKSKDIRVYAMGTSAGGNIVLSFSYPYPQIKKVLAINPVMNVNFHLIKNGIKEFVEGKINVVFGEHDSSTKWVELLPNSDNLSVTILPNIDHEFRGNLQSFIDLPNKFLFND